MTIMRIEKLVFGVADIGLCAKFHQDAGLELIRQAPDGAELRTQANQIIALKHMEDPGLPPALEKGPGLRELVWGMEAREDLARLGGDLAQDRAVRADQDGVLHTHDESGLGIGFAVSEPGEMRAALPARGNMSLAIERWNRPLTRNEALLPLRICHVAYNIVKANHQCAIDFYVNRLGFKPTDIIQDTGTFMHCPGGVEHHDFFLCFRPDAYGFNHFALEMGNFDDLILAGNRMVEARWEESRVLGRHLLGSNFYRFFKSPAGGRLEFAHDMDRYDETYEPRIWATNPGHHIWTMKSSGHASG